MTQTPLSIQSQRQGESSVEEEICDALRHHLGEGQFSFHSAGREDLDVRMLGRGRPFVIQLSFEAEEQAREAEKTCLSEGTMQLIENQIQERPEGRIEVEELKLDDESAMERIKAGEQSKKKQYACIVWISKKISDADLRSLEEKVKELQLEQKTPVRVMHRRSALIREKIIHSCSCEAINSQFFVLRLEASAGTYIKEFIHGDFGRTLPSVGSLLGCDADIIQLDVEEVITEA